MTEPQGAPRNGEPRLTASCRKPNAKNSGGHKACPGAWATGRLERSKWIRVTGKCSCKVCNH